MLLQEGSTNVYSGKPITLCGHIYTDMVSNEAGIAPGKWITEWPCFVPFLLQKKSGVTQNSIPQVL